MDSRLQDTSSRLYQRFIFAKSILINQSSERLKKDIQNIMLSASSEYEKIQQLATLIHPAGSCPINTMQYFFIILKKNALWNDSDICVLFPQFLKLIDYLAFHQLKDNQAHISDSESLFMIKSTSSLLYHLGEKMREFYKINHDMISSLHCSKVQNTIEIILKKLTTELAKLGQKSANINLIVGSTTLTGLADLSVAKLCPILSENDMIILMNSISYAECNPEIKSRIFLAFGRLLENHVFLLDTKLSYQLMCDIIPNLLFDPKDTKDPECLSVTLYGLSKIMNTRPYCVDNFMSIEIQQFIGEILTQFLKIQESPCNCKRMFSAIADLGEIVLALTENKQVIIPQLYESIKSVLHYAFSMADRMNKTPNRYKLLAVQGIQHLMNVSLFMDDVNLHSQMLSWQNSLLHVEVKAKENESNNDTSLFYQSHYKRLPVFERIAPTDGSLNNHTIISFK